MALAVKLRGTAEAAQVTRSYEEELRDFKRRLVMRTLQKSNGNKAEAARVLGVARGYLHRLIHDLKIQTEETSLALTADDFHADRFLSQVLAVRFHFQNC